LLVAVEPGAQAKPFDQLHDDERKWKSLGAGMNGMNGNGVRRFDGGCRARFALEPLTEAANNGKLGPDDFDGHSSPQPAVVGTVNGSHAAATKLCLDVELIQAANEFGRAGGRQRRFGRAILRGTKPIQ
jgi:hypothetical protein